MSADLLDSLRSTAVQACLDICSQNQEFDANLKKLVLPYYKNLAPAYFRLNNPTPMPFYEHSARRIIQDEVILWLFSARKATQIVYAASALKNDSLPVAPEDLWALSSLATLLHALVMSGYAAESEIVSDEIPSFVFCKTAAGEDSSFRKANIAAQVEQMGSMQHRIHSAYENGDLAVVDEARKSGTWSSCQCLECR